jgi:hypothetical protein
MIHLRFHLPLSWIVRFGIGIVIENDLDKVNDPTSAKRIPVPPQYRTTYDHPPLYA